jgi:hypothetical protein
MALSDPAIKEQRMEALAAGNEIRIKRAAAKRAWKGTDREVVIRSIAALVADPPDWAQTWKLAGVLRAIPGWGPDSVTNIFVNLEIHPNVTLGKLKVLERLGVVEVLQPQFTNVNGWDGETTL